MMLTGHGLVGLSAACQRLQQMYFLCLVAYHLEETRVLLSSFLYFSYFLSIWTLNNVSAMDYGLSLCMSRNGIYVKG